MKTDPAEGAGCQCAHMTEKVSYWGVGLVDPGEPEYIEGKGVPLPSDSVPCQLLTDPGEIYCPRHKALREATVIEKSKPLICYHCHKPITARYGVGQLGPIHWSCWDEIADRKPTDSVPIPAATPKVQIPYPAGDGDPETRKCTACGAGVVSKGAGLYECVTCASQWTKKGFRMLELWRVPAVEEAALGTCDNGSQLHRQLDETCPGGKQGMCRNWKPVPPSAPEEPPILEQLDEIVARLCSQVGLGQDSERALFEDAVQDAYNIGHKAGSSLGAPEEPPLVCGVCKELISASSTKGCPLPHGAPEEMDARTLWRRGVWDEMRGTQEEVSCNFAEAYAPIYGARREAPLLEQIKKSEDGRKHTQDWYARHYGKLEDWARKRLPDPWRNEFFHCIANGTWGHADRGEAYMSVGAGLIVPSGYFKMETAAEQLLHDQATRAELAESEATILRAQIDAMQNELLKAHKERNDLRDSIEGPLGWRLRYSAIKGRVRELEQAVMQHWNGTYREEK